MLDNVKRRLNNIDLKKDWDKIGITLLAVMMYFGYSIESFSMEMQHLTLLILAVYTFWLKK